MGNGVTTDSIKTQKYDAKVAKQQAKEQAKLDKQKKEAEKQAIARDLLNNLAGASDEKEVRKIRSDIKDNLEEMYKSGQITKEEYKQVKKYANSSDYKEYLQSELDSDTRILVAGVAGKAKGTSIGDVKDEVKDALKTKLENKEITQEEYDKAKKYSKTGTWIGRFFGKKEKESRQMFQTREYQNKLVETKNEGPKFSAKLQAKMNLAGISTDQVYEIGKENGGGQILEDGRVNGDATINYSYKKKQPGEMDAVQTAFNNNESGVKFSKRETNKIMKQAGYHVEKKINWGKAIETGVKTAAPVSPLEFGKISASAAGNAVANVGSAGNTAANATASVVVKSGGILTGAAFLAGTGVSAYNQAHRVEDRAIPTNVPEGVTTYEQYAKYLDDNYSTTKGAALGKDIAKQFVKDGKLDVEGLNNALKTTAGTIASTSTPLNKREGYGLLMSEASKEKKAEPKKVVPYTPVIEPQDCEVVVEQKEVKETKAVPTDCYKVKSGDNWYAVAKAKYGASDADAVLIARQLKDKYFEANKEELAKVGIKTSKGAFFAKVGEELCVPSTVTINGKKYTYNTEAKVTAGTLDKNYKGATIEGNGNLFTKTVTRTIYNAKTCDEKVLTADSKEAINAQLEELNRQNPDKHYVIVEK